MLSWVDDILALGYPDDVKRIKTDLQSAFVSKSEDEMKEYVGNKVDVVRQSDGRARIKVTQPVLVQKLCDEFELPDEDSKDSSSTWSGACKRGWQ